MAFASLGAQVGGLLGRRGILPAGAYLDRVRGLGGRGARSWAQRLARLPTVFWLGAGDGALRAACSAGIVLALLLVLGVAPAADLLLLWALYLSLCVVGRDFLSFQWDVLLLEAGFLALLLVPWRWLALRPGAETVPSAALLLLWWLLFRLVFQSGVGKLTSGDRAWRDLTALSCHWWTQPLPAWPAWYAARLPEGTQRAMTAAALFLEIPVPFLVFAPGEWRLAGFAGIVLLQLLISLTGSYGFFNLLTVALALLLLDDGAWAAVLPGSLVAGTGAALPAAAGGAAREVAAGVVGAAELVVGGAHLWRTLRPRAALPRPLARLLSRVAPWRTINSYGLFRIMTTRRPELVLEGSRDGSTWCAFRFRHKPGDPARRPGWTAPHMPRLDWQMWFEALGGFGASDWFPAFLSRLLEGSEPVRRLLAASPFGGEPPSFVRAVRYEYRFAGRDERKATGRWWRRERAGTHGPAFRLAGSEGPADGGPPRIVPAARA